ncbi:MAG TPA: sigma-70 family RNA polymerase sigma factor [Phycisphaerae bacterium]|nr:sigma-70 family RNA polymerase sigma factor [Phycisphaerae bacterium]HNU46278.1 sigma-70 family RNA polymerase sigma factor [Phycisphaerae bacterium]
MSAHLTKEAYRTPASPAASVAQPRAGEVIHLLPVEDQVLLTRLLTEPMEYVDHPRFALPSVEIDLFGARAELVGEQASRFAEPPSVLDRNRAAKGVPTLSPADEQLMFMRFNYARRQVGLLLKQWPGKSLTLRQARHAVAWGRRVLEARSSIVQANMPLVLAMAKRTRLAGIDFSELISEGNLALLRSVEKFDCARGYKFSTYSCRAILKSFSRVAMRASRYRGYFPTEFDANRERSDHVAERRDDVERDCVDELKEILLRNLAGLSEVEQTVIQERFALVPNGSGKPTAKTLEEVGHLIGVTKERVRQIQNKALRKIRLTLEGRYLAA